MATKPQTTASRRAPDVGETLQKTLEEAASGEGATEAPEAAKESQKAPEIPVRAKKTLPTEKSEPEDDFAGMSVFIYGVPKIGKSTLASQFADGDVLFLDVEGGLNHLSVYKVPVEDWASFLEWCAIVTKQPLAHRAVVIDTMDILSNYCSAFVNAKLGIVHESDAEWGKAWSLVRQEFQRALAKLAATPNLGLIMIGHSVDVEIKTRNSVYNKAVPTLPKSARETVLTLSDLILYCDFAPDEDGVEQRIIRTKPSPFYEAGERGSRPRLPETLPLSYDALKEAWHAPGN